MTTGSVTPAAPTGPTCKTCKFRPITACRRYPPVAAVGAAAIWPSPKDDDWCGEHQQRSAPASQAALKPALDMSPCTGCGAPVLMRCQDNCPVALARFAEASRNGPAQRLKTSKRRR